MGSLVPARRSSNDAIFLSHEWYELDLLFKSSGEV